MACTDWFVYHHLILPIVVTLRLHQYMFTLLLTMKLKWKSTQLTLVGILSVPVAPVDRM